VRPTFLAGLALAASLLTAGSANATLVNLGPGSFTPAASVITFSEVPLGTVNPTYTLRLCRGWETSR